MPFKKKLLISLHSLLSYRLDLNVAEFWFWLNSGPSMVLNLVFLKISSSLFVHCHARDFNKYFEKLYKTQEADPNEETLLNNYLESKFTSFIV